MYVLLYNISCFMHIMSISMSSQDHARQDDQFSRNAVWFPVTEVLASITLLLGLLLCVYVSVSVPLANRFNTVLV